MFTRPSLLSSPTFFSFIPLSSFLPFSSPSSPLRLNFEKKGQKNPFFSSSPFVFRSFSNQTPPITMANRSNTICLFDIDGTLTMPRLPAEQSTLDYLKTLREKVTIGIVGGSDQSKALEQLGKETLSNFDYCFFENGLVAYKQGELIHRASISSFLGDEKLKQLINFILHYIADLDIPVKRGTFIEFRSGMLNVSPIGRNCSQEERLAFNAFDNEQQIRKKFVAILKEKFADFGLSFSIGGQISFDVFPNGWDKTYCLRHIEECKFEKIHFFGDKTDLGGNDHEIYVSEQTIGHKVGSPKDTLAQLQELFP